MSELNPFSSEYICPSQCEYVAASGGDHLLTAIREANRLSCEPSEWGGAGQIVGPHGCGKSTLANAIGLAAAQAFSEIHSLTLRPRTDRSVFSWLKRVGVHRNPFDSTCYDRQIVDSRRRRLLILDGVERLSSLSRCLLFRSAGRSNTFILTTTHRRLTGIRVIAELRPELAHFHQIVDNLQRNVSCQLSTDDISNVFQRFNGNYRLSLRHLYDVYARAFSERRAANLLGG